MRKTLLASLLLSLAAAGASAAPLWYDVMTNYNGCITTNVGSPWFAHLPGSLTANDAVMVTNTYTSGAAANGKRFSVNGLNSEYVMRLFDPVTTNVYYAGSGTILWASFIANASFVPAAGVGTYFAAFDNADTNIPPQNYTNGFDFRGRISQIGVASTAPLPNRVSNTKVFQWGIANNAADAPSGIPSILFPPIDAVGNVDYQLVMKYDINNASATLWVNPASASDTANMAGPTSDLGAVANGIAGFLFRQRTTGGTVGVHDVVVGLSFADVMTNTPGPVLIATNYNTVTNFAGNPGILEVFATSIGGGALSYQWYRFSGGVTNAVGVSSQTYVVASLSGTDTGSYFCAVTNVGLLGAVSTNSFYISVNTTPTPPFFTSKPPVTTNGTVGGKLTLAAVASGTGPLTYQWSYNNNPLTDGAPVTGNAGDLSVVSGSQTANLTVTGLSTNETGNYSVLVTSGATGLAYNTTNATVAVTVNPARVVNIAYIRSLEDTNTANAATTLWQITDTGSIFTISNAVVTMFTNVTSGTTASYYIQDATGGLDMFVTGDATFRPQMGDLVSISGTLSSFSNAIELMVDTSNPYQFYGITGHTNVLPAPMVVPLSVTNNAGNMETNLEGRIVMLTNVGFTASLSTPAANGSLFATNSQGIFQIFFPSGTDADVKSKTLQSRFAYTITGVMSQFKSGAWNNSTYEVYVTRIGDIVTNPPPAVTVTASTSGNNVVLNWTAVPYTETTRGAYSYSVLAATDVIGPYLPLATGMAFNTTNGTYTDINALLGTQKFYKIVSP